MTNYICFTCGVQHAATDSPPNHCPICEDERQYIGHKGQLWITPEDLKNAYHNRIETVDLNLTGIGTVPGFAIGQRALLVQTPAALPRESCATSRTWCGTFRVTPRSSSRWRRPRG